MLREHVVGQCNKKCFSSSVTLHTWHTLSSGGNGGRVYRPVSMAREWLNLASIY